MTSTILITLCLLLLLAYVFDISSPLTKIPSVILLMVLGWLVKRLSGLAEIHIPDLNPLLPVLGTLGLILIVMEGSLELELNQSKKSVIKKSFLVALLPLMALAFLLAFAFNFFGDVSYKTGLVNAIPFCVISSAIAIPSVRSLSTADKEFIIYDSSLSDILGVLFFNFVSLNEVIDTESFVHFGLQIVLIVIISFAAVLGLSFLLSRISHHISYTPIILLVILIYAISKEFHLPSLIFILVFGLFLGNLNQLKHFQWIEKFGLEKLDKEIARFKDITVEATFLIRALFFILFGFLIQAEDVLNLSTLPWAIGITAGTILIRWCILKYLRSSPALLWVVPRGLITVLLFLSIASSESISFVNKSLVLQIILLSVLTMMIGLMANKDGSVDKKDNHERPSSTPKSATS